MDLDWIIDGGYLPHGILRFGIRSLLRQRLSSISHDSLERAISNKMQFVKDLCDMPVAIETKAANSQHYEVSTGFHAAYLGPRLKYSSCLYPSGRETIGQAEVAMLDSYVEKLSLEDGMSILDLGCGWGSAAIYFAELFPKSRIIAFSNSKTQKEHIDSQITSKGLTNVSVIMGDVSNYSFQKESFDRIISVELFEHMKNYQLLLEKLSYTLNKGGKLFVHIFAHKDTPYHFEDGWMTKYFFTGGTMPSADLLLYFQKDLKIKDHWWINGKHYARTLESWLARMQRNKNDVLTELRETYGKEETHKWFNRWAVFFIACAELFAYGGGEVWGVAQYLFEKP